MFYRVRSFCLSDMFFFFKQKTAYEMRISDWSSDVCSSDLLAPTVENQSDRIRKPALGRPCGDAGAGTAIQSPAARWMLKHVQHDGKRHACPTPIASSRPNATPKTSNPRCAPKASTKSSGKRARPTTCAGLSTRRGGAA